MYITLLIICHHNCKPLVSRSAFYTFERNLLDGKAKHSQLKAKWVLLHHLKMADLYWDGFVLLCGDPLNCAILCLWKTIEYVWPIGIHPVVNRLCVKIFQYISSKFAQDLSPVLQEII